MLEEGDGPSTPDVLLADARETVMGRSAEHDVRRGVLLAAIAAEVKINTTLAEKTPTESRNVLNYQKIPIGDVPAKIMGRAVGRSLRDDDPNLFCAVKQLFECRNTVAHHGESPSLDEARRHLRAR
jgi:hypothetical protein